MVPKEIRRILLVSASEQMRDDIASALAAHGARYQFFWMAQPDLVAVRARELLPHVVLLDATAGTDLARAVRTLVQEVPGAAVLALLNAHAMGEARQAMLAGARGFVIKPVVADDLLATLEQLQPHYQNDPEPEQDNPSPAGGVIVFCAPKGGTGRTTTAVNTAVSLQRLTQQSVVLIDADYSAPALDVVLNLHDQPDIRDLLERLARLDPGMLDRILAQHASGLHVLLAPPPGRQPLDISLPQIQQILAHLRRRYTWVIVDLGLPLDETAYAFLDGSDQIVMTVLPEMVGLRNTRLMLDQLADHGHPSQKIRLVLNRADIRGGVRRRDIERRLRVQISYGIPDDQPLASHSINRGVPLVISHERSAVARSMQQLARMLVAQRTPAARPAEERGRSLLANLFRRLMPTSRPVEV